jgi:hypothetical protein
MDNIKVGQLIGERELVDARSGKHVVVRIGVPRPFSEDGGWYCPYEIHTEQPRVSYAAGLDAIQALQLVMRKIGFEIQILNEQTGGTLEWNGEQDLGFPTQLP